MNGIADFQPELRLRIQAARGIDPAVVEEFCGLLRGRGLVTAREICKLRPEWYDEEFRFVRRLRVAAGMRVVSGPGTAGYQLAKDIPLADLDEAINRNKSQIRAMAKVTIGLMRLAALKRKEAELVS